MKSNSKINLSTNSNINENSINLKDNTIEKKSPMMNLNNKELNKKNLTITTKIVSNMSRNSNDIKPIEISNNIIEETNLIQRETENQYVIYDCFRNMLNKNKLTKNSSSDDRYSNKMSERNDIIRLEDKLNDELNIYSQNYLLNSGNSFNLPSESPIGGVGRAGSVGTFVSPSGGSCNINYQIQSLNLDNNYEKIFYEDKDKCNDIGKYKDKSFFLKDLNNSEYYSNGYKINSIKEFSQNPNQINQNEPINYENNFNNPDIDSNLYSYSNYNNEDLPLQEILFSGVPPQSTDQSSNRTNINKNLSKNKNNSCTNINCKFYSKRYRIYKKSHLTYRKKYFKEKKLNGILNMKLFYYENNKFHHTNSQSDKLNTTAISTTKDDETKLTKLVFDKLQENFILFEKLENEILNKDATIEKQSETIKHLKSTIDKLLEQFNVFTTQGNYVINDLLILKQNVFEKNFKEVTKDFDDIGNTINEYTNKIKEFSDMTKNIKEDENLELSKSGSNTNMKKLNTIQEEISSDLENNESDISFSLTKSNIKNSNTNTTSNMDRSLRLLDLSNNYLINSQNENQNYFKDNI
jgi:uncharacterized protein YoxC